jgi:hypothetical protein
MVIDSSTAQGQTCYMCEAPAVSREHVPAACFFPGRKDSLNGVDQRCNLITVPSCDQHNSKKSKDDEYLWFVIAASEALNECGQRMVRTKVTRSIKRRPGLGLSLLREATPAQVFDAARSEWVQTVKAGFDGRRVYGALEMFGRALYFHHFNLKWQGAVKAFAHFAHFNSAATPLVLERAYRKVLRIADPAFQSAASYGKNQEVFSYQVYAEPDLTSALMRATFYGRAAVTLAFTQRPMGPN